MKGFFRVYRRRDSFYFEWHQLDTCAGWW